MPLLWGLLMIVAGLFLVLCGRSKSEFIWQQDRTRRLFYGFSTGEAVK